MDKKTLPEQATHYRINANETQMPVTQAEMDAVIDRLTGVPGGEEMRRKIAAKQVSRKEVIAFWPKIEELPALCDAGDIQNIKCGCIAFVFGIPTFLGACLMGRFHCSFLSCAVFVLGLIGLVSGFVIIGGNYKPWVQSRLGKTPADLVRSRLNVRNGASKTIRHGVVNGVLSKLAKWMKDKTRVAEFRERAERAHERMREADVKWGEELNRQAAEIEAIASLVNHTQTHDLQNARALLERITVFTDRMERVEQMTHAGVILGREDFPDEIKSNNIETLMDQVESALPSSTPSVRIDVGEDENADDDSSSSCQAFRKATAP